MQEIPSQEWTAVLNAFTAYYGGWFAVLTTEGPGERLDPLAIDVPLIGISADEDGGESTIAISLGDSDAYTTHLVQRVRNVSVDYAADGRVVAVQIESKDGTTTTLRVTKSADPNDARRPG